LGRGSHSNTTSPAHSAFPKSSSSLGSGEDGVLSLLALPEPAVMGDGPIDDIKYEQVHAGTEVHKLHKHKLDKLTICSIPTEQLRQHVMAVAKSGTRSQIVHMVLSLHEADEEEVWLTVLGEDYWREVFEYLDMQDILTRISLVCSTFHQLVKSGDCFRRVNLSPIEDHVKDQHMYSLCKQWSTVVDLDLSLCENLTNTSLQYISTYCKHITSLNLSFNPNISEIGLRSLTHNCKDITKLSLASCDQMSDEALRYVGTLHELESIELDNCTGITDEGLQHLVLPKLKSLFLGVCANVTDYGIINLVKATPQLEQLRLELCADVTDQALQYIATSCHRLKTLGLERGGEDSGISDEGVMRIAHGCRELRYLDISNCVRVSDDSLIKLAEYCPSLERLFLTDCDRISDLGVKLLLKNSTNLQSLSVARCTRISDASLKILAANCPHIEFLDISCCFEVTDIGVSSVLRNCHNLLELYCRECTLLTDETFFTIKDVASQLQTINFGFCEEVTDEGLFALSHCEAMKDIRFEGVPGITDRGIKRLCDHAAFQPEIVHLGEGNAISDLGVIAISEKWVGLQEILIRSSNYISNTALTSIASNCANLNTIGIESLPITDMAIETLVKNCPQLDRIYVYCCDGLSGLDELSTRFVESGVDISEGCYDGVQRIWVTEEVFESDNEEEDSVFIEEEETSEDEDDNY